MQSIAVVKICLESPQKNDGVDRIHSVISYDSKGKEIKNYQELAYNMDFFYSDDGNVKAEIINYVSVNSGVSKDKIIFENDVDC